MSFVSSNRTTFTILLICLALYAVLSFFVTLPGEENANTEVKESGIEQADTLVIPDTD